MTNFEMIRKRLEERAGIFPAKATDKRRNIDALAKSEWCYQFEQLQRNRLIMGGLRYGLLGDPHKKQYDRIAGVKKRLGQYQETGNTECLVDIANLMQLEFVEGRHPKKHFGAIEGDHCCM